MGGIQVEEVEGFHFIECKDGYIVKGWLRLGRGFEEEHYIR